MNTPKNIGLATISGNILSQNKLRAGLYHMPCNMTQVLS